MVTKIVRKLSQPTETGQRIKISAAAVPNILSAGRNHLIARDHVGVCTTLLFYGKVYLNDAVASFTTHNGIRNRSRLRSMYIYC